MQVRSIFDLRKMCPISPGPHQPQVSLHPRVHGHKYFGESQCCPCHGVRGQPGLEMLYTHPTHHGPGTRSAAGAGPRGAGAWLQPPKALSHARGEGDVAVASLNLLPSSLISVASPQSYREGLILHSKHLDGDQAIQWMLA